MTLKELMNVQDIYKDKELVQIWTKNGHPLGKYRDMVKSLYDGARVVRFTQDAVTVNVWESTTYDDDGCMVITTKILNS